MVYSNSGRNATPDPSPSSPNKWVGPAFDPANTITFSSAGSHKSQNWQAKTMTAGQLLDILTAIKVGRKAEGSVWAPATFNGGRRSAAAALGTFIMPFDSDGGTPFADVVAACQATGWHMVVIPSSSWGGTVSEISGDAFDVWKKEDGGEDASIERYLIEVLEKTPAVAAGATILASFDQIEVGKDGRGALRKILRIQHQPCEKYRILAFLSQRYDLSTPAGRRAWKRSYDAACDVLGLPLDRTSGSVERLLFQSRLPAELIDQAREHIRVIPGGTIDVTGLPEPKPRVRTRRGPSSFRDEKVHGRGSDDEVLEYHWIDPVTGTDIDLRKWAVGMKELQLADILRDGDWPLDDRGEVDGKLHIDCPFKGQHTSLAGGGTYVSNAADFERTGMVDRQKAAVIHCSHNSCKDRDRLEFVTEFLRHGSLTTEHLYAAKAAAKAIELAADFEPIEDGADIKPLIEPRFDWDRATIEASLPQLKRLAGEDPESYQTYRSGWDIAGTLPADELDLLVDMAANDDIPPKVGNSAGAAGSREDPIAYWLNWMNQRYFVAPVKGKTLVVSQKVELETDQQTRQVTYDLSSFPDITHLYANKIVWIESKQKPKPISVGTLWLTHPERRTYLGGMVFKPKGEVPPDCFNTWQGFGVEPAVGDWSQLRWHMQHIICAGDERHFDWLLKWCAHMVQVPMIKSQVAIVMRGGEGCGKGTLGHVLRRIAGSHGFYVSSQRGVVGNFNAHLANRLLLFADEAFFAGDKQHEGVLKALISEKKTTIEPKGIDPIQQDSYLRIVMATNNAWAVPAGIEARRFFVLDVPNKKTGDKAYFDALNAEIDGGGLAAFLHDLLQVDLTGWNDNNAPKTAGLMDQKLRSLRGVRHWYHTRLERAEEDEQEIEGIDPLNDGGTREYSDCEVWVRHLGKTQLYDEYTEWSGRQKAEYQPVSDSQFWKDMREMAPSLTTERKRKAGRKGMVHLPPLAKARDEFEKFMGGKVPWPTDGGDEDAA